MRRMKRMLIAAGLALSALAVPFASTSAHATCISVFGSGCLPCPKPITVAGKEIVHFYCTE